MAYVITEPCIGVKDGTCIDVCPVDCIEEDSDQMVINPELCIDCDLCVTVCPVNAIYNEAAVPDEWMPFVERNRTYFSEGDLT